MKVRASIKKEVVNVKLSEEKVDYTLLIKKIQDLNKDKVNYGKNFRNRYTKG